jgi:hypothetical protein
MYLLIPALSEFGIVSAIVQVELQVAREKGSRLSSGARWERVGKEGTGAVMSSTLTERTEVEGEGRIIHYEPILT